MNEAFLFDIIRTPIGIGNPSGSLYEVNPLDMLSTCLQSLATRNALDTRQVRELVLGCATPVADQGANIARAAVLSANWSPHIDGMQINKFESSGLEAINICCLKLRGQEKALFVAGGVESMSRVRPGQDQGPLYLDPELVTTHYVFSPGLSADLLATCEAYDRSQLDDYAWQAQQAALEELARGSDEKVIIPILDKNGLTILNRDEFAVADAPEDFYKEPICFAHPNHWDYDAITLHKFPQLEHLHHVHSSKTSIKPADGAALALIGSAKAGRDNNLTPKAKILSYGYASSTPSNPWHSIMKAVESALEQSQFKKEEIDLWASYDPFAAVGLFLRNSFGLTAENHNRDGGLLPRGAPQGAIGPILLANLLQGLANQNLSRGLLAIPTQSGMASAMVIERL